MWEELRNCKSLATGRQLHTLCTSVSIRDEQQPTDWETARTRFRLLLSWSSRLSATDPRDHVFAVAGLIPVTMAMDLGDSTLFVTANDYFARCPVPLQQGDVITILSRSIYPVVLRPNEDGTWAHVSHAYVHGIMAGEFVQDLDKLERKEFWLR